MGNSLKHRLKYHIVLVVLGMEVGVLINIVVLVGIIQKVNKN